jgi:cyclase
MSRRTARLTLMILATTLQVGSAHAQARDSSARLERIGDGVYAIIHDNATDEWPHGNTGVVVTDEGVLVVDAAYLPSRARADIALIRSITDQPVRYLVYTHWHFDHTNGAVAYREAFPGVTIVSERETARFVELNATWWAKMSTVPKSGRRAALAELEARLASGRDSAGRALPGDAKRRLEASIHRRRGELEELSTLVVMTPDLLFDRALTLVLGGRRIELRDRGRANSPHDVTVHLPGERVLFTGDILVQDPYPYVSASWPVPWIAVLRDLEATPVSALVPGHGPVMRDHDYTAMVRELLETVTSHVESMARRGMTLDEIQAAMDLGGVRRKFRASGSDPDGTDWRATVTLLVERAWRSVRGQGG